MARIPKELLLNSELLLIVEDSSKEEQTFEFNWKI